MIKYFFFFILIYFILYNRNNKENFSKNNKKKEKKCESKKVRIINTFTNYLDKLNTNPINNNIHIPDYELPYNFDVKRDYNILNQYGIKNDKKRREFNKIIDPNYLPYNSHYLLKNYDRNLSKEPNETLCNKKKQPMENNLYIMGDRNKLQWSILNYDIDYSNIKVIYTLNDEEKKEIIFNKNYIDDIIIIKSSVYKNRTIFKLNLINPKFNKLEIQINYRDKKSNILIL